MPDEIGITVSFTDIDRGMSINIAEEDIGAIGLGEITLEEYADIIVFNSSQVEGFELVSRESTVTDKGLEIVIFDFNFGPGGLFRTSRLIYINDMAIAFNATYVAFGENFEELKPLIAVSFDSLSMTN